MEKGRASVGELELQVIAVVLLGIAGLTFGPPLLVAFCQLVAATVH